MFTMILFDQKRERKTTWTRGNEKSWKRSDCDPNNVEKKNSWQMENGILSAQMMNDDHNIRFRIIYAIDSGLVGLYVFTCMVRTSSLLCIALFGVWSVDDVHRLTKLNKSFQAIASSMKTKQRKNSTRTKKSQKATSTLLLKKFSKNEEVVTKCCSRFFKSMLAHFNVWRQKRH